MKQFKAHILPFFLLSLISCQEELIYENSGNILDPDGKTYSVSVKLDEPGTLQSKLEGVTIDRISSLTINGPINGNDLAIIREMAGADKYGNSTEGNLKILDLSQSAFKAGGEPDFIYVDEEDGTETSISLQDNEVSRYAFGYCKLQEIVLPEAVTCFASQAFFGCDSLLKINIPSSLEKLGKSAFCYCHNLCCDIVLPSAVTEITDFAFYQCYKLPSVSLNGKVRNIGYASFTHCHKMSFQADLSSLQSIDSYSFCECRAIDEIMLPSTITQIPDYAFYNCKALEEADLSNVVEFGDYCFYNCPLIYLILSPNLHTIGKFAFYNSRCAHELSLPESLTFIGIGAFYKSSITGVLINSDIRTDDGYILDNNMYISENFYCCENLTYIKVKDGCKILGLSFYSCKSLTNIELPSSLDSIGFCFNRYRVEGEEELAYSAKDYIFADCTALTSITLPPNLKFISNGAFSGCTALTAIDIPETANYIGAYCFNGCSSLEHITLPKDLSEIPQGCFQACTSLHELDIPSQVKKLSYECFAESGITKIDLPDSITTIDNKAFFSCSGLSDISIPSKVTSIESETFMNCSNLESVHFASDSQLQSIGSTAFYKCTSLSELTLPYGLTEIGQYAFGVSGLQSIAIPSTVQVIGEQCFAGSSRLQLVINESYSPQDINENVFDMVHLSQATLKVPSNSLNAFSSAPVWSNFGTVTGIDDNNNQNNINGN